MSFHALLVVCLATAAYAQNCGGLAWQPMAWETIQGPIDARPGQLIKVGGASRWDSGAISQIKWQDAKACVSIQFNCNTNGHAMLGVGHGDSNAAYQDIDFAWYCNRGKAYIYQAGKNIGNQGTYSTTTVFSITVTNGQANLILDGVTKKSYAISRWPIQVDTSLHTKGIAITNIKYQGPTPPKKADPCDGLAYQNVNWRELRGNLYAPPGMFTKVGRPSSWDSGAISSETFKQDECLKFIWKCPNIQTYQMVGIGHITGSQGASYTTIDIAIYCAKGGTLQTYENGKQTTPALPRWSTNNQFTMYHDIQGKSIVVKQDDTIIRSWPDGKLNWPVVIDIAAHTNMATATGIQFLGKSRTPPQDMCKVSGFGWQKVAWKNIIGALNAHPGRVYKSGGGNAWNAGASSVMRFNSSSCLRMQFQCTTAGHSIVGIANKDVNAGYTGIDVAWYCNKGSLRIWDRKKWAGTFGTYTSNTKLGITFDLETQSFWFWRDGLITYATLNVPISPWVIDSSIHTNGNGAFNVMYWGAPTAASDTPCKGLTDQLVQWTGFRGQVYAEPGKVMKVGTGNGWNTGAISTENFEQDECLDFTWQCNNKNTYTMLGVGHPSDASVASYTSIDYAVYCAKGGKIYIYERGANKGGNYGSWSGTTTFRMTYDKMSGSLQAFKKDSGADFTSIYGWSGISFPLVIDAAMHSRFSEIDEVKYKGQPTKPPADPCTSNSWAPMRWRNIVGALDGSPGSLTRKAGGGWNAGAASLNSFNDSTCLEVTFQCLTSGYAMLGISYGDTHQSYTDIDVAWYCAKGTTRIYTKGTNRGSFGTYTQNTVFRIKYDPGTNQVYLYKGDKTSQSIMYSWAAPQEPFLIDTSVHTKGMALLNVQYRGTPPPMVNSCGNLNWQPIQWRSLTGNAYGPPGALKMLGGSGWTTSAFSVKTFTNNECVSVKFACRPPGVLGLTSSAKASTVKWNSMDLAIYCSTTTISFYTAGSNKGNVKYTPGTDTFTLTYEASSSTIKAYQNDNQMIFSWSTNGLVWPLVVDANLGNKNAELINVWYRAVTTVPPITCTNNWNTMKWKLVRGRLTTGDGWIKKPSGSAAWDSGAASAVSYAEDQCIDLQFNCNAGSQAMIGMGYGDNHASYTDIDVAVYCNVNNVQIYKKGKSVSGVLGTYNTNTQFRMTVDKETDYIFIMADSNPIWGEPVPRYPITIDTSVYKPGSGIVNVKWAGSSGRNCGCPQPTDPCQMAKCDDFGNCQNKARPDGGTCGKWFGKCSKGECLAKYNCACMKDKAVKQTVYGPRCALPSMGTQLLGTFIDDTFNPDHEFGVDQWTSNGQMVMSKNGQWTCIPAK